MLDSRMEIVDSMYQIVDAIMNSHIERRSLLTLSLDDVAKNSSQLTALRGALPRQLQVDYQLLAFILIWSVVTVGVWGCMIYNFLEDKRFWEKQEYMMRPRPQRDENEVDGEVPDQDRNPEVVVAPLNRWGRQSNAGERNSENIAVYAENLLFLDHAPQRGTAYVNAVRAEVAEDNSYLAREYFLEYQNAQDQRRVFEAEADAGERLRTLEERRDSTTEDIRAGYLQLYHETGNDYGIGRDVLREVEEGPDYILRWDAEEARRRGRRIKGSQIGTNGRPLTVEVSPEKWNERKSKDGSSAPATTWCSRVPSNGLGSSGNAGMATAAGSVQIGRAQPSIRRSRNDAGSAAATAGVNAQL